MAKSAASVARTVGMSTYRGKARLNPSGVKSDRSASASWTDRLPPMYQRLPSAGNRLLSSANRLR